MANWSLFNNNPFLSLFSIENYAENQENIQNAQDKLININIIPFLGSLFSSTKVQAISEEIIVVFIALLLGGNPNA